MCCGSWAGGEGTSGSAGFALINNTVISTGLIGTYNISFTSEFVATHSIVTMDSDGNWHPFYGS
jgi:hypothetical protein